MLIRTRNLTFNQKTGDANTDQEVEFQISQGKGSAIGLNYGATSKQLTLEVAGENRNRRRESR